VVGRHDKTASFGIDQKSGYGHCFRCKVRVTLQEYASEADSINVSTAPPERADISLPPDYTPLWREPGTSASVLASARQYLADRGIGAATIQDAFIGACTKGRCAGRVVVPALGRDGRTLVGWSARLTYKSEKYPKYLTATGMDRQSTLFNMPAIRITTDVPLMLVEGIFDALPYWPNAVAFLGKPSPGQLQALVTSRRPLVCVLDGDSWLECEMLHYRLRMDLEDCSEGYDPVSVTWLHLPPCTDPGNIDAKKLWNFVRISAQERNNLVV